jgi:hypothetical protein
MEIPKAIFAKTDFYVYLALGNRGAQNVTNIKETLNFTQPTDT